MKIAALYVANPGVYFGLPDVDPWDVKRDARRYEGPDPVIAHPPCARWCRLAKLVESQHGTPVGADDGCFLSALRAVRNWGGVLEHPAFTMAWAAYGLLEPNAFGWTLEPMYGSKFRVFLRRAESRGVGVSDLAKPPGAALEDLKARAVYYGQSTLADKTKKTYATEYGHFRRWAESRGLQAMPPDIATVAVYLAALADGNVELHWEDRFGHKYISKKPYKYGSIQRNYISIIHEVRAAGYEWPQGGIPAITKVLHGIKYRKGDTKRRMAPLEVADLRACLAMTRERRFEDLTVLRDRAMLSLGFFAALRSAELVAICLEDLDFTKEGVTVLIRKSKTDQFSEGVILGLRAQGDKNICPVALLRRYLDVSEIKMGPIFRRIDSRSDCYGDKALTKWVVARIVKAHAEKAGLDPERFASHSLRAGFVTTAAAKGVPLHQIMRQTRHKDQRVAMTYIRPATVWNNNPTEGIGDEEPKK